ncbi:histidine protein methyltransferase 1 homolog isoform X2 [Oratosquilla oratoria]|uniref:histidine protein methyltransferase 1 homolog isoform X2 n=1 Tax=Oratosquilla oratoria TaxID=337810 RepID=UPI003F773677
MIIFVSAQNLNTDRLTIEQLFPDLRQSSSKVKEKMFKFNFAVTSEADKDVSSNEKKLIVSEESSKCWFPAKCHYPRDWHQDIVDRAKPVIVEKWKKLKYLTLEDVENEIKKAGASQNISPTLYENTDLVPAVYEGGLKIWECTWDLMLHLDKKKINFDGIRVLELGCGAGLVGLYASIQGAHVFLQDYNEEVINYMTIPNAILNLSGVKQAEERVRFFSGDWGSLCEVLESSIATQEEEEPAWKKMKGEKYFPEKFKFDLILTSETIYNPDSYGKLLKIFKKTLKSDAKVFLAAKSYYFGVGGGTYQFKKLIEEDGVFDVKSICTNDDGVRREILELMFKQRQ